MTRPDLEAIEARCRAAIDVTLIIDHNDEAATKTSVDDGLATMNAALADIYALTRYVRELEGRLGSVEEKP